MIFVMNDVERCLDLWPLSDRPLDDDSDDEPNPLLHFLLGVSGFRGFSGVREPSSTRTTERPEVLSKPPAKPKYSFIDNLINL